jgi:hypothetical protein
VDCVEVGSRIGKRLGGKRQMGPERALAGPVAVYFTDPVGNLIGGAGRA